MNGVFTCSTCGKQFLSPPIPADVRIDDLEPLCDTCIEAMLDAVEPEPISDEKVDRILRKVREVAA
jgi:hypothetical protein